MIAILVSNYRQPRRGRPDNLIDMQSVSLRSMIIPTLTSPNSLTILHEQIEEGVIAELSYVTTLKHYRSK